MPDFHAERPRGAYAISTVCIAAMVACSSSGSGDPDSGPDDPDGGLVDAAPVDAFTGPKLLYQEVQQKSSHNSYQRHEALLDQLIYHRVRSLELDIHHSKGGTSIPGDWFVYHTATDQGTSCIHLSDCLREVAAFHDAVPAHEVVTLWIDLKTPFSTGHRPDDLDALLTAMLPGDTIFGPADLMAACPTAETLQAAVTGACAWPDIRDLRGRVIAVLTGGTVADPQAPLAEYLLGNPDPAARAAFVAPDFTDPSRLAGEPNVVFFNMARANHQLAAAVHDAGFIGRVWDLNTMADFDASLTARAHHLATDKINYLQDVWSATHDSRGWPFRCIDLECPDIGSEPGMLMAMLVDSGDIWNNQDSFFFAYEPTRAGAHSWTGFVSTVNSHVEEWGKGCLMARASTDADAAYFAVCRPADRHPLRVQIRSSAGASSQATEADIVPANSIAPESVMFVRLDLDEDARCAAGYGSQDGANWQLIAQQCFAEPLSVEGIAASSHDSGLIFFVFGNITRSGATLEVFDQAHFSNTTSIGANASGALLDGTSARGAGTAPRTPKSHP